MKQKLKTNKGITLIALIVTIIVLLILATVTIKLLVDSGIVGHAKSATNKYVISKEEEQIKLAYNEYKMSKIEDVLSPEETDLLERYCLGENKKGRYLYEIVSGEYASSFNNDSIMPNASSELEILGSIDKYNANGIIINFTYKTREYRLTTNTKTNITEKIELINNPGTFTITDTIITGDEKKGWIVTFDDTKNEYYVSITGKVDKNPTAQEAEELLKKYFMESKGETGTLIDVMDSNTGKFMNNDILSDANAISPFHQLVNSSDILSGNLYIEYKNKVYVLRTEGLVVKDVKFIYEKKGREGQTVKYSYDGTPENEKDWTILYDYGDSVEIISPDVIYGAPLYLGDSNIDLAIKSYNDAVKLMHEHINTIVTNPNKISVRCAGSNPENPLSVNEEMYSSDDITEYDANYNGKGRCADINYEQDLVRIRYHKLREGDFLMPSCNVYYLGWNVNFVLKRVVENANSETDNTVIWNVSKRNGATPHQITETRFRPIVKIKY